MLYHRLCPHYVTVTGPLKLYTLKYPRPFPPSFTPLSVKYVGPYNFSYSPCLAIDKVDNNSTALEALCHRETRTKLLVR